MGIQQGHCVYCSSKIDGRVQFCPSCEAPFHSECWDANGNKCGIYGCGNMPAVVPQVTPNALPNVIPLHPRPLASDNDSALNSFLSVLLMLGVACGLGGVSLMFYELLPTVSIGEVGYRRVSDGQIEILRAGDKVMPCGKTTIYKMVGELRFGNGEVCGPIKVRFNDGAEASISGAARYELPNDSRSLDGIFFYHNSQKDLEQRLIYPILCDAAMNSAALLSTYESFSNRHSDLSRYFFDQAENGIYLTKNCDRTTSDPISGKEVTSKSLEIARDDRGEPIRFTKGQAYGYGIHLNNMRISTVAYQPGVEKIIMEKLAAETEVAKAKARLAAAEMKANYEAELANALVSGHHRVSRTLPDDYLEKRNREDAEMERHLTELREDFRRSMERAKMSKKISTGARTK